MKIRLLLLITTLTFISDLVFSQGLGFKSIDSQIANRTSYTVFAEHPFQFKDKFSLSFDLSILDPNSFGFICVIDAENSNKDYSLAYIKVNQNTSHLKLNLKGEENLLTIPIKSSLLGKGKWINVMLNFDLNGNHVTVTVNNDNFEIDGASLDNLEIAQIYFGKNENLIDVPSFSIRNLNVRSSNLNYNFKFKEYAGNTVHDQNGRAVGRVENPVWLINDSYHWKHRFSYSVDQLVAANYDQASMKIYIAEKDSLAMFDMGKNTFAKKAYANSLSVPVRLGSSFFANNKLFVYEVNDVPYNSPTIASIDLNSYKWQNNSFLRLGQQRHHHNAYLNDENQQLIIFGGFGNNRLSNSFNTYNIPTNSWSTLDFTGDVITPRFFAGMGSLNDKLILFGGVGNKTGDQSIGKIYYYDCYSIDLKEKHITKLWELDRSNEKLVSTRNLIFSEDKSSFYTLCYPEYIPKTHIKLYKYNINTGKSLVLGDSIPVISEEILTNANLYLNSNNKELYCVIQEVKDGKKTKISVYSIDNPPISTEELDINTSRENKLLYYIIGGILLVLLIIFVLGRHFIRKKKNFQKNPQALTESKKQKTSLLVQPKRNAIYTFGLFTAYNRNGQDCTHLFSPQIKQLFLLILLRSRNEGISSEEIYSLVWPEKPLKNAKNLKGVSINKIRTILSDFDGIELLLENQHFIFKTRAPFYCDDLDLLSLFPVLTSNINDEYCQRLIEISSRGEFLQSGEQEYFDPFKRDYADQILVLVPDILKHYYTNSEFEKTINIANVLYSIDELNEVAFYYIINSYLKLNDEGSAKKQYNSYILKYKKVQGEDFSILFPELIKISAKYLKNLR